MEGFKSTQDSSLTRRVPPRARPFQPRLTATGVSADFAKRTYHLTRELVGIKGAEGTSGPSLASVWSDVLKTLNGTNCSLAARNYLYTIVRRAYKDGPGPPLQTPPQSSAAALAAEAHLITSSHTQNIHHCLICLEQMEEGVSKFTLACGHSFHACCIHQMHEAYENQSVVVDLTYEAGTPQFQGPPACPSCRCSISQDDIESARLSTSAPPVRTGALLVGELLDTFGSGVWTCERPIMSSGQTPSRSKCFEDKHKPCIGVSLKLDHASLASIYVWVCTAWIFLANGDCNHDAGTRGSSTRKRSGDFGWKALPGKNCRDTWSCGWTMCYRESATGDWHVVARENSHMFRSVTPSMKAQIIRQHGAENLEVMCHPTPHHWKASRPHAPGVKNSCIGTEDMLLGMSPHLCQAAAVFTSQMIQKHLPDMYAIMVKNAASYRTPINTPDSLWTSYRVSIMKSGAIVNQHKDLRNGIGTIHADLYMTMNADASGWWEGNGGRLVVRCNGVEHTFPCTHLVLGDFSEEHCVLGVEKGTQRVAFIFYQEEGVLQHCSNLDAGAMVFRPIS